VFFAFGDAGSLFWMLLVGIVLHAICYDFFFVAGQIYTDKFAGARFRSAAQGLITLATYGAGILIGSLVSGPIVDGFATADGHNWTQIWIVPAIIAGVVLLLFLILFKDRRAVEQVTLYDETRTTIEAPGTAVPRDERPRQ
jgi:MFS family permease